MARPMPRLPPVTRTLCIVSGQFAGCGDFERWHESNDGGDLVRRQRCPAILEYFVADYVPVAAGVGQNDVRYYDRAGDRAAARPGAGHADLRMPVDHGLDLLWMHFQAAD